MWEEPYPDEFGYDADKKQWTVKGGEAKFKQAYNLWCSGQNFPILCFFTYEHLPESLQAVSKPFCELAVTIDYKTRRYASAGSGCNAA